MANYNPGSASEVDTSSADDPNTQSSSTQSNSSADSKTHRYYALVLLTIVYSFNFID